jgi:hypothetical protein
LVKKDDGDTPGLTGTLSGDHLGQVALSRDQWEQLESNLHENRAMGKKVRWITDVTSIALRKEEMAVCL